ncbi:MAG: ACT domain-containing protein [Firmicutes bacterium]|nr:ACT domain-containing protein [Bacillota bacterium]
MNAVITVVGHDKVGIIAKVSTLLYESNINILDLSQTIMQGNFTMVMLVDVSGANKSFKEISEALVELGKEIELTIRIQREEIFDAMHTI